MEHMDMFADKIEELQEAEEFAAFAKEVRRVAPVLQKNGTGDVLVRQTLLFSMEDGESTCVTYLQLLHELYTAQKLIAFENPPAIIQLPPPQLEGAGGSALSLFTLDNIDQMVLCLDITSWIGNMDTPEFEAFLLKLYDRLGDFIFVFRVPYLENSVLREIAEQIQDILSLRILRFPPWSYTCMTNIAQRCLARYGFQADAGAMEVFRERLQEERSDGRFYGYATIRKVAEEMLYQKQRRTAEEPFTKHKIISRRDVEGLLQEAEPEETARAAMQALIGRSDTQKQLLEAFESMKQGGYRNMFFVGEAGTGKTSMAAIVGRYMKELGLLEHGRLYEQRLDDLIGVADGETVPHTMAVLRDAEGSILFVDELETNAFASPQISEEDAEEIEGTEILDGFRTDAMHTLFSDMQYHNDRVVIFAGTEEEIGRLRETYPESSTLVPYMIRFARYSRKELAELFMDMLRKKKIKAGEGLKKAVFSYFKDLPDDRLKNPEFTNARYVSNLIDHSADKAAVRSALCGSKREEMLPSDFLLATKDSSVELNRKQKNNRTIGFELP